MTIHESQRPIKRVQRPHLLVAQVHFKRIGSDGQVIFRRPRITIHLEHIQQKTTVQDWHDTRKQYTHTHTHSKKQNRATQHTTLQRNTHQNAIQQKTTQEKRRLQDKTTQDKARQDKTRQDNTLQFQKNTTQDYHKTITRKHKIKQDNRNKITRHVQGNHKTSARQPQDKTRQSHDNHKTITKTTTYNDKAQRRPPIKKNT
jgi:hypothetical protein